VFKIATEQVLLMMQEGLLNAENLILVVSGGMHFSFVHLFI